MRTPLTLSLFALLTVNTAYAADADADAGKAVYATYCTACHQADGKGMNGMLGANFVDETERMKKTDEVLIASIRDGFTGTKGVMPPWGAVINEQQQIDVLAYIRATFKKADAKVEEKAAE